MTPLVLGKEKGDMNVQRHTAERYILVRLIGKGSKLKLAEVFENLRFEK